MTDNELLQNIAGMLDVKLDEKLDAKLDEKLAGMVTKKDLDERLAGMVTKKDLDEILDERLAGMVTKKDLAETRRSIENSILQQVDIVQEKSNEHYAILKADIDMLKHAVFTNVCKNTADCFLEEKVEDHDKRICAIEKRIS